MCSIFSPVVSTWRRIAEAINSGPLSLRMCRGTPRVRNRLVKMSSTRSAVMLRQQRSGIGSELLSKAGFAR